MRMWRKPLAPAYQIRAFQKRHAVPFSAAFQQPAARLCDPGSNGPPSAYNGPKRARGQACMRQRSGPSREGAPEVIGGAAALERALPHQGQNGESGNRNKNGKGKTAVDIDRKHVLIACAIAGPVLGVVLAVLQAVAPHAAGARAHRRDRADACGEDPAYRRAALRPPPRQRPAKPGAAARTAHRGQAAHRVLQAQGRAGAGREKRSGVQSRTPSAGV